MCNYICRCDTVKLLNLPATSSRRKIALSMNRSDVSEVRTCIATGSPTWWACAATFVSRPPGLAFPAQILHATVYILFFFPSALAKGPGSPGIPSGVFLVIEVVCVSRSQTSPTPQLLQQIIYGRVYVSVRDNTRGGGRCFEQFVIYARGGQSATAYRIGRFPIPIYPSLSQWENLAPSMWREDGPPSWKTPQLPSLSSTTDSGWPRKQHSDSIVLLEVSMNDRAWSSCYEASLLPSVCGCRIKIRGGLS